jgi:uncharacterized protein YcbK (DUF882 family)
MSKHNYQVGGSPESQHRFGRAADIKVQDVEPQKVYDFLIRNHPESYGIGLYSGWVHIDSRTNKSRWQK